MRDFKKLLDDKKENGSKKKDISAVRKQYKNAKTQLLALKSARQVAKEAKKLKKASQPKKESLEPSPAPQESLEPSLVPVRRMRTRSMDAADMLAAKRARQLPPKAAPSVHRMRTRSMDEGQETSLTPVEFRKKHKMHIVGMHESGALGGEYKVTPSLAT